MTHETKTDIVAEARRVIEKAADADATDPSTPRGADHRARFTDAALADEFARAELIGRYAWAAGLGWLAWDGRRWAECGDVDVVEVARRWALSGVSRAVKRLRDGPGSDDEIKAWLAVAKAAGRLAGIARLARGVEGVRRDAADFDARPDLLNTPTGVVDLTTGKLLPHDPDLLLTKMTGVGYDPDAKHADWSAALEAVPEDIRAWLQVRYGQAATGYMTPDDRLIVQQGSGENGKTTVTAGVAGALGDYYLLVSDRVLLANPGDHPTELTDLRGARLAMIEETPEARRLSEARLKKTVGTPQITARRIRQNNVTFDATHSLFLSTNYKPVIEETDHGTWRRLALVRYPYTYRKPGEPLTGPHDRTGDPTVRQRVEAGRNGQHEAVLAWLVAGAVVWYRLGRVMPELPERIETDTRKWRLEADVIMRYREDHLVFDHNTHIMGQDLQTHLNAWLVARGHKGWSAKLLASRFGEHDEVRPRVEHRRVYRAEPGLSRPPQGTALLPQTPVPERFHAWTGVRFRTPADDQAEAAENQACDTPDDGLEQNGQAL